MTLKDIPQNQTMGVGGFAGYRELVSIEEQRITNAELSVYEI